MIGKNLVQYRGQLVGEDSLFAFQEKKRHIEETTPKLLSILRANNVKLTFFVTGRLYKAIPDTIHAISEEGHEIGWHGHHHRPIVDERILREELDASKNFILTFAPKGFRAPWTLFKGSFLPILKDAGFVYDSSVFAPIGYQYEINGVNVLPVTSFPNVGFTEPQYTVSSRYLNSIKAFPVGSNFILSLLRYRYDLLLRFFARKSESCVFYIHNWQLFPWPERELSLKRDKLRYVQAFPLNDVMQYLFDRHKFYRMETMLEGKKPFKGHFLSYDME